MQLKIYDQSAIKESKKTTQVIPKITTNKVERFKETVSYLSQTAFRFF